MRADAASSLTDAVLKTTVAGGSRPAPGGFHRGHTVLLVGEANFSFALALALALGTAENIVATSERPKSAPPRDRAAPCARPTHSATPPRVDPQPWIR